MSRISAKFAELEKSGQKALIAYIMAGYPDEKSTLVAIRGLIKGGADIIELGFPFSDPLADGPVIQNAGTISLKNGTSVKKFFAMVKKIRAQTDIPLVLMTYTNILYRYGYSEFIIKAKESGIDGIILPDMAVEESKEYLKYAKNIIDTIFLISPNTNIKRMKKIANASSGFLYMVAVYGTTGVKTGIQEYTLCAIRKAKTHSDKIPIGVGFGVSTPEDVQKYVSAGADATIVGSAFLKIIKETPYNMLEKKITIFTKSLKKATTPIDNA